VFPGGTGQTELQLQAIAHFRADGYAGTPDFLKILLDKAAETGTDVASLRKALVGGGALPPSLRAEIGDHGVAALQCYGTADLGLIAYESEALEGMILDESLILLSGEEAAHHRAGAPPQCLGGEFPYPSTNVDAASPPDLA